ncbi:hypothetical protein [Paracidovorax oryzae]
MQWLRMFVQWHGLRHPRDMGQLEIEGGRGTPGQGRQ